MTKLNQVFFVCIFFAFLQCSSAQITELNMQNPVVVSNVLGSELSQSQEPACPVKLSRADRRRMKRRLKPKARVGISHILVGGVCVVCGAFLGLFAGCGTVCLLAMAGCV